MATLFLLLAGFIIGLFSGFGLIFVLRQWSENLDYEYPEVVAMENKPFDDPHH